MNGYLPYAPSKESIFHGNHGYPRHYRPPHRMPPHYQSPQRGYPRMNNYSPRSFSYPQRVHPNNMSYSRPPVYHSKSHHPRYLPQTLTGDSTRTSASSYRYGDTKDMNTERVTIKQGMAQTPTEELQISAVQTLLTQSRMRRPSMPQPCQTQISVARAGIEQHSMLRPRSIHFSTAQTETPKVQSKTAKHSLEQQPRMPQSFGEQFGKPQMPMSRLESFTSTAQSSVPVMTQTSMYQQNMTETSVMQPQISILLPKTVGGLVTSSVRQCNMSESSATQHSISHDRMKEVTTRTTLTPARQEHTMFQSPQRSATHPRITKTSVIESGTSQKPAQRPSLQKTSITQSRMRQTSVSPPQTSMPIVHSGLGSTKMSLSDPRVEQTSQAAPTQPTSMVKTSMAQHIKQKSSQSNQMTAKPSDGSEKQPFLVQYPVRTLYNKQWKTNCTPTTVNSNFSKKGTNVPNHSNSDVQRYQPYPKVTHGEVNVQNHNPPCTKATEGNSGVKCENFRKNRWDLKKKDVAKSLQQESVKFKNTSKSDYKIEVNFEETNHSGCNNNNTESFEINHCKTGGNKVIVKSKVSSQSGYTTKDMCFLGKQSSNNELENNKTSSNLEKMEMSNNFDSYENENSSSLNDDNNLDHDATSDTDIRNVDHSDDDELDNKDAAELLMSMSNRSIKISRLIEEQKRLMASTSLIPSHQNNGESAHF